MTYSPSSNEAPILYEDIRGTLEMYEQGLKFKSLVTSPAWEAILDYMRKFQKLVERRLIEAEVGDPKVPTLHAAANTIDIFVESFQRDIEDSVAIAMKPPTELQAFFEETAAANDPMRVMRKS